MAQTNRTDIENGNLDANLVLARGTGQTQPLLECLDDGTPPLLIMCIDPNGKTIGKHQVIAALTGATYTALNPTAAPVTVGDHTIPVTPPGGGTAITLPLASNCGLGFELLVGATDSTANTITFTAGAGDSIVGRTAVPSRAAAVNQSHVHCIVTTATVGAGVWTIF